DLLLEQLGQMAWNGELEGWLTTPPQWHLVADADSGANWAALLESKGETLRVVDPVPIKTVAELSARQAAAAERQPELLPAEYGARYQRQYVDRLWMRGLGAVVAVYLAVVVVYFGWLEVVKY